MDRFYRVFIAAMITLAAPLRACAGPDPLAGQKAQMEAQGYGVQQILTAKQGGVTLEAVLYRQVGGEELNRLNVYTLRRGKATLAYMDISQNAKIELASVHDGGSLPRLFGESSPFLAYTRDLQGIRRKSLVIVRYDTRRSRWIPVAGSPFPNGSLQDLDGDGVPELLSKSLPLGYFFTIECRDFEAMTRTAFKTTIYRWKGGRFVDASAEFLDFYDKDLLRLKDAIDADDPRKTKDYGGALGLGLSVYYDFAQKGQSREGWKRFSDAFTEKGQLPPISTCIRKIKNDIRAKLGVPEDWRD